MLTVLQRQFRFFDEFEARESLHNRREKFTSALICGHMDPFFQECRAYGRLIEKNVNGKVAVRCHGYMMIPADRELELDQRFGATTWDRPEEDYSMPESKREPFRALVKDLVTEDPPLTSKIAKKMVFDLRKMRSYGILNMDIAARNYMSGLLIDFGFALTSPSLQFIIGMGRTEDMRDHDLIRFDGMLDEAGIVTLHRARSNPERVNSLRPRNNEGRDVKQPGPSRGILEGSKQA